MVEIKKLPHQLTICGKRYKVKYLVSRPLRKIKDIGITNCNASFDYEGGIISVWCTSDMHNDYILEKLLHECIHGFEHISRYSLEEHMVVLMSNLLIELLRNNPKLLEMIK